MKSLKDGQSGTEEQNASRGKVVRELPRQNDNDCLGAVKTGLQVIESFSSALTNVPPLLSDNDQDFVDYRDSDTHLRTIGELGTSQQHRISDEVLPESLPSSSEIVSDGVPILDNLQVAPIAIDPYASVLPAPDEKLAFLSQLQVYSNKLCVFFDDILHVFHANLDAKKMNYDTAIYVVLDLNGTAFHCAISEQIYHPLIKSIVQLSEFWTLPGPLRHAVFEQIFNDKIAALEQLLGCHLFVQGIMNLQEYRNQGFNYNVFNTILSLSDDETMLRPIAFAIDSNNIEPFNQVLKAIPGNEHPIDDFLQMNVAMEVLNVPSTIGELKLMQLGDLFLTDQTVYGAIDTVVRVNKTALFNAKVENNMAEIDNLITGAASAHQEHKEGSQRVNFDDISVDVDVTLARTQASLKDLKTWNLGTVVDLGDDSAQNVSLSINGSVIAVGDLVAVDGRLAVQIKQLYLDDNDVN